MSELLHHAKAARTKEKQWHALNGREKLLFLEAVSKQWSAWQENAAATVIPPAEAKVIARSRDAVTVCARGQKQGKSTAENHSDTQASARNVVPGYADPNVLDIRRDHQTLVAKPSMSCWPSVPVKDEKMGITDADVQAAFLKGEFQDEDRVLYCWPPKNGTALPGVQPGSLLLILKRVFGSNDAPRKWWEKISEVLKLGLRSSECVLACLHCTLLLVF